MRKIKITLMASAAIVAAVSCSSFQEDEQMQYVRSDKKVVFTATREGVGPETKTIRMEDGSTAWLPGDEIGVVNDLALSNEGYYYYRSFDRFVSQNTEIAAVTGFVGEMDDADGGEYYAVYPYHHSFDYYLDDKKIGIAIFALQEAVAGNFSDNAFPAVAKSATKSLHFYNIGGGVKFSVSRNDIKSVSFSGNNGETLAGRVYIVFGVDGIPVLDTSTDYNNKTVTLVAPDGGTFEPGKEYYMTLIPAELSKGFTMTFSTGKEKGKFVSEIPQTVKRSVFGNLGTIDTRVTEWKSTIPEMVDLGLSAKWASWNLGAASPEDYGDQYAWGETSPKAQFLMSNYRFFNPETNFYSKYTAAYYYDEDGEIEFEGDGKYWLDPEDDAAHVLLGGEWRMPSSNEMKELLEKCTWTVTTKEGVDGYLVTSNVEGYTDKSIFLPAAGVTTPDGSASGKSGLYYSGEVFRYPTVAMISFACSYDSKYLAGTSRSYGGSIRAVSGAVTPVNGISLPATLSLDVGERYELDPVIEPENATYQSIFWTTSDVSVASIEEDGTIYAHSDGSVIITATTVDGRYSASCEVTVSYAVPEAVDLGLSVKWASMNLGAYESGDYGRCFAWGETSPKFDFMWDNYKFNLGSDENGPFSKYVTEPGYGTVDGKYFLDLEDDAAHAILGEDWRIPSSSELQELLDLCTWEQGFYNGYLTYKVTSTVEGYTDKYILVDMSHPELDEENSFELHSVALMSSCLLDTKNIFVMTLGGVRPVPDMRAAGFSILPVYGKIVQATGLSVDDSFDIGVGQSKKLPIEVQPANATYKTCIFSSSDESVAVVDEKGVVYGKKPGDATITVTLAGYSYSGTCEVTVSPFEAEEVDLGLSVKWASCNIGATAPEDYGSYYAFGETEPKTIYEIENYKFYVSGDYWDEPIFSKYVTNKNNGVVDNKYWLDPEDDVAQVISGGEWRMPSSSEFMELVEKCNEEETTENGVAGMRFTSRVEGYTDKSIFLPFAGCKNPDIEEAGSQGHYLSSEEGDAGCHYANIAIISDYGSFYIGGRNRWSGYTIRPVKGETIPVTGIKTYETLRISPDPSSSWSVPVSFLPESATHKKFSAKSSAEDIASITSISGSDMEIVGNSFGNATITVTSIDGGFTASIDVTVGYKEPEAVDLGLSVKWAAYDLGPRLQWGSIYPLEDYYPSSYYWTNYPMGHSPSGPYSKYVTDAGYGMVDHKIVLDPEDDAVQAGLGGGWRLPTRAEVEELLEKCTWTYEKEDDWDGRYIVTSKGEGYTDRAIIFPLHYFDWIEVDQYRLGAYIWTANIADTRTPYALALTETEHKLDGFVDGRVKRFYIRPVQGAVVPIEGISLESSLELPIGGTKSLSVTFTPSDATYKDCTWSTSDASVVTVDAYGVVSGLAEGTATITAYSADGKYSADCAVTVKYPDPQAVDLGLSVKWADMNIGARAPEAPGDAFAWGETSPKESYGWGSYRYNQGSTADGPFSKYVTDPSSGTVDHKQALDPADDAAAANWGGKWRMPTRAEVEELLSGCYWNWTEENGVSGYRVSGKKSGYTGNSIFIPVGTDGTGRYWTSTMSMDPDITAYGLDLASSSTILKTYEKCGEELFHVRAVSGEFVPVSGVSLDKDRLGLAIGSQSSLVATVSPATATHKGVSWTSSDATVATVDADGVVKALAEGSATVTVYSADGAKTASCVVEVTPPSPYEAVDMGLSVKWATCNVGAENPEDAGDFFAWGGTSVQESYGASDDVFNNGTNYRGPYTKYVTESSYGTVDGKTVLELSDDVANKQGGAGWRIPTVEEMRELRDNCRWKWTTQNGVNGYLVTSRRTGFTDKSIFLPAQGYMSGTNHNETGTYGSYWASTLGSKTYYGTFLYFKETEYKVNEIYRYYGRNIRPVTE